MSERLTALPPEAHHELDETLSGVLAENKRLREALEALTMWSVNGSQLCFRARNGAPMGMSRKQEQLARNALRSDTQP